MRDVMEKLEMEFRIVKLQGFERFRVQYFAPTWFGLGRGKWKFVSGELFDSEQEAQRDIDWIRERKAIREKHAWVPTK